MSIERSAPESIQEMLQPLKDGVFRFACHPGVPCFTECCRDLRLLLTPYDIMRLKNALELDARGFLDEYTSSEFDERRNLPMIYLKMLDNDRKSCPFVSQEGCRVYEDRPAACRTYPLARASRSLRIHGKVQEDYLVLHEAHCRGFEEGREWTADGWIEDQGLELFNTFNDLWMGIITHSKLRHGLTLSAKQQQMFFLTCYNMDKFRSFVLESRFLQAFELSQEDEKAIRESDEGLLKLGFDWLRFSLFNEPTLKMRQAGN